MNRSGKTGNLRGKLGRKRKNSARPVGGLSRERRGRERARERKTALIDEKTVGLRCTRLSWAPLLCSRPARELVPSAFVAADIKQIGGSCRPAGGNNQGLESHWEEI